MWDLVMLPFILVWDAAIALIVLGFLYIVCKAVVQVWNQEEESTCVEDEEEHLCV